MKEYLQILLNDDDLEVEYSNLPELPEGDFRLFPEGSNSARLFCLYLKKYITEDILIRKDNMVKIFSYYPGDSKSPPYIILDQAEILSLLDAIQVLISFLQPERENLFYSYRFAQRPITAYGLFSARPLGKGGFSEVFGIQKAQGKKKVSTGLVAKKISNDLAGTDYVSYHEIFTLMTLKHPNIISLLDVINLPYEKKLAMIMPQAEMDLAEFIRQGRFLDKKSNLYSGAQAAVSSQEQMVAMLLSSSAGPSLSGRGLPSSVFSGFEPSPDFLYHIHSLISGLNYIHERDFWHRDIKPANILYLPGGSSNSKGEPSPLGSGGLRGRFVYSDFGISDGPGCFNVNKTFNPFYGTTIYKSPESLLGYHKRNLLEDVWALGIIFAQILLFSGSSQVKQIFGKTEDEQDILRSIFQFIPIASWDEAKTIMKASAYEEASRSNTGDLLEYLISNSKIKNAPDEIYQLITSMLTYMNTRPDAHFLLEYFNEFVPQKDLDPIDTFGFEISLVEKTCRHKMEYTEAYPVRGDFLRSQVPSVRGGSVDLGPRQEVIDYIRGFLLDHKEIVGSILFLSVYLLDKAGKEWKIAHANEAICAAYMVKYDNGLKINETQETTLGPRKRNLTELFPQEEDLIERTKEFIRSLAYDIKKLTFYDFLFEKIFSTSGTENKDQDMVEIFKKYYEKGFNLSYTVLKYPEISGYYALTPRQMADFIYDIIFFPIEDFDDLKRERIERILSLSA